MFKFENLDFTYVPYPIGVAKPILDPDLYGQLVSGFPPLDLFEYMPTVGHKYALSETRNADQYWKFINGNPVWRRFMDYIEGGFTKDVFRMLLDNNINLGMVTQERSLSKRLKRWIKKDLKRGRLPERDILFKPRFEFSAIPAAGGNIKPHTDVQQKIVSMVVSVLQEGEWDPACGGATELVFPKDVTKSYNMIGDWGLDFDEVDVLHKYEFRPNQAVFFVKTFNSWHAVQPMNGADPNTFRRTLTINIELVD
jgi:hypothetical protein